MINQTNKQILFQSDQIDISSCCHALFHSKNIQANQSSQSFMVKRNQASVSKIKLVTPRKKQFCSQQKVIQATKHQQICDDPKDQIKKRADSTRVFSSVTSKTSTIKNSLKTSQQINFNSKENSKETKINESSVPNKSQSLTQSQEHLFAQNKKGSMKQINNISGISSIEEQFQSNGSTSLNALNIILNLNLNLEDKTIENTNKQKQLKVKPLEFKKTPLERLLERKQSFSKKDSCRYVN